MQVQRDVGHAVRGRGGMGIQLLSSLGGKHCQDEARRNILGVATSAFSDQISVGATKIRERSDRTHGTLHVEGEDIEPEAGSQTNQPTNASTLNQSIHARLRNAVSNIS